jgi:hypothetical protein
VTPRRPIATALAAALAALAAAGCGAGAGEDVGGTSLLVTQDFGARTLVQQPDPQTSGSDTVMRLLERNAERVEKRYGGGFVQAIDGVAGGVRDGRQVDWFFYVNGRLSDEGAAATEVNDGDRIWWDHHDWDSGQSPAVVGSFPAPFTTGFEGKRLPVRVECVEQEAPACTQVRDTLVEQGVVASRGGLATSLAQETLRVLVGPWTEIRGDAALGELEDGPEASGVYAKPSEDGTLLEVLDERGRVAQRFDEGWGLVAATAIDDAFPVWVVTGRNDSGLQRAAAGFTESVLAGRYAVAFQESGPQPLPAQR